MFEQNLLNRGIDLFFEDLQIALTKPSKTNFNRTYISKHTYTHIHTLTHKPTHTHARTHTHTFFVLIVVFISEFFKIHKEQYIILIITTTKNTSYNFTE